MGACPGFTRKTLPQGLPQTLRRHAYRWWGLGSGKVENYWRAGACVWVSLSAGKHGKRSQLQTLFDNWHTSHNTDDNQPWSTFWFDLSWCLAGNGGMESRLRWFWWFNTLAGLIEKLDVITADRSAQQLTRAKNILDSAQRLCDQMTASDILVDAFRLAAWFINSKRFKQSPLFRVIQVEHRFCRDVLPRLTAMIAAVVAASWNLPSGLKLVAVCSSKRQPILSFVPTIDQEFPHDRFFRRPEVF